MAKQKKKTKRMPIKDMPQEFLNEERDPVDFDALMNKAISVELKERCNKCPLYDSCYDDADRPPFTDL